MTHKTRDIIVLLILPAAALVISTTFSANLVWSSLLFFGMPSAYLIWRKPEIFTKSFIFSFIFSFPLSVVIDALAVFDKGWYIPESIVPYRLFGVATLEVYVFDIFWVLFSVLFYEYFFDRQKGSERFPKAYKYLLLLFLVLMLAVVGAYYGNPSLLVIPYFYAWASVITVMFPLFLFGYYFRKFIPRLTIAALYFFYVMFLFEVAAFWGEQWIFPGTHFIGWVEVFGISFPFEEFVFWMIFATPALLAYYEFFADDRKL